MSKNQKSNKENKKKALLTPKEKKAAKRDKAPINTLVGDAIDNGKHHRQQGK
ncbi:hypothetical protein [Thiohalophilus sp.]|uniref:hypothetical protein n=1 Tax=Thiohalophilus sp. TaxID=3028392 RepID=UPI002ACD598E|nr:hypothetical protein [Thiohalophilus sp.]MDZ7803638.1 hypothetical protein [Thiohalophilus sp.]